MDDFVITAAAMRLAYAVLGIVMLVFVSRWLDGRAEKALARGDVRGFGAALAGIRTNPLASAIYYGARILAVAVLLSALMGCTSAQAGPAFPDRYDPEIKRAVGQWWPDYPVPAAWKAQLYQESRLDPRAVSPVGAAGLAQMMPGTWEEVRRELRLGAVSPHHEVAVEAGAYYMAKLRRGWSAKRTADARQELAQASYNAGAGSIIKAQAKCGGPPLWGDISPCLASVTGERNAHETRTYVERIAKWRSMMVAGL